MQHKQQQKLTAAAGSAALAAGALTLRRRTQRLDRGRRAVRARLAKAKGSGLERALRAALADLAELKA